MFFYKFLKNSTYNSNIFAIFNDFKYFHLFIHVYIIYSSVRGTR